MAAALHRSIDNLFICRILLTESDVLPDGQVKKVIILSNIRNLAHLVIKRKILDVYTTKSNLAFIRIPQRINESCNRTLAGTGRSDDRTHFTLLYLHVDTMENLSILITESDVIEFAAKQLAEEPILLEWEIGELDES